MTRTERNVTLKLSAGEIQEGMFVVTHDGEPRAVLGVTRHFGVTLDLAGGACLHPAGGTLLTVIFPQAVRAGRVQRGDFVNVRGALEAVTDVRREGGRVILAGASFEVQADEAGFVNVTPPLPVEVRAAVQATLGDGPSCAFTLTADTLRVQGAAPVSVQVLPEAVRAALWASCAAVPDEDGRETLFVHVPRPRARAFDALVDAAHAWRPGGAAVTVDVHWDEAFTLTCGARRMDFLMRGQFAVCRAGAFDLTMPVERYRALSTVLPGVPVREVSGTLTLMDVPGALGAAGFALAHVGTVSFGGGLLVSELLRAEHPDGRVLSVCTGGGCLLVGGVPAGGVEFGWDQEDEVLFGMSDADLAEDGLVRPDAAAFQPAVWRLRPALVEAVSAALSAGTLVDSGAVRAVPGQLPAWVEGERRSNLSAAEQVAVNAACAPRPCGAAREAPGAAALF
ncbi:hypothetical protein [Deinococcus soli (ex Cha et al. 2016)]|uniref:Uncharacterized protein n=2 Tax=Deinococcus soli (ex Cha et al. 2016) TaxID=1309411 RepID=A0ACC6KGH6_9DEIO|nr:hypothetical protein [Deinococcus soli (ex Cha et al. 2016)]MDR6218546.1 hypothetical protein [Deinococcus soli (ex Cha et al. 2016)]MDR6329286.1 hypothetical protein [Deinococcus soli (ex Cha et al. 2016)]MDR6751559.1 hypothetical protein [Deinococcus soli (ex Cha et al. 2016)]